MDKSKNFDARSIPISVAEFKVSPVPTKLIGNVSSICLTPYSSARSRIFRFSYFVNGFDVYDKSSILGSKIGPSK